MSIVEKIQELCTQKGITLTGLERELNIGRGIIKRWASSSPNMDNIQKVADYFHVSVDYLLGREEKQDELLFLRGGDKLTTEEREELKKILQMSADVYLRAKGLID